MVYSNSSSIFIFISILYFFLSPGHATTEDERGSYRSLLSFKETPAGSNITFECSPSGPCVPCLYPDKKNQKYRCSETGYRIPMKCEEKNSTNINQQTLLAKSEGQSQTYITYRSCIPAINEEKLSVLGFEGIMLFLLLVSGWFVYLRKRQNLALSSSSGAGQVRNQMNSRF